MKPKKRIWELQSSTVCKVVGMALVLKDLQQLARHVGITPKDPLMDEEFALHTTIVQLCLRDNLISRHTEKTIEKKFQIYEKKIPFDDPIPLISEIREDRGNCRAPIWAILWGLATRGKLAEARIETSLFGFIHMMEHKLMRDQWNSSGAGALGDNGDTEKDDEILRLQRDLLDMQWANKKLEKFNENIKNELDLLSLPQFQNSEGTGSCESNGRCACANNRKIQDLKGLLNQAKFCNYELETENAALREEIDNLIQELDHYEQMVNQQTDQAQPRPCCPFAADLRGKRVTLVGGVHSLEQHYRRIIESLGGSFRRHDGTSPGGDQALEDCILGSDLVVCPVEVNSHNAAKAVKKICKARGVRCCFPRSASITGLKRALEEHYSGEQVA